MSDDTSKRKGLRGGLSVLVLGAAACAACCIGPIVAFLGTIGVLGVLSTPFVGMLGLVVAVAGITSAVIIRRGRPSECARPDGPVPVDASSRRG